MTALVVLALLQGPEKNATYQDIAQAMIQIEPVDEWKQFIENQFTQREVLGGPAGLAAEKAQSLDWDKCCGTLKHPDHVKDTEAAIKKALKKK
ncbi:MAG: hypothetical protein IH937_10415 [Acidobacteria bacterium]|nr:hypothetical protein [Acidobacteriota bacterium]